MSHPALDLRGPRVLLRPWRASDLAPFAAMNADPEVMEHLPAVLTREESDAMEGRSDAHLAAHGFTFWAVEVPGEMPFVGFVGLVVLKFESHFTPCVEMGWRLAREQCGKGYAAEAARVALRAAFGPLRLREVVAVTVPTNLRSRRVMERLGMRHTIPCCLKVIDSGGMCSTASGETTGWRRGAFGLEEGGTARPGRPSYREARAQARTRRSRGATSDRWRKAVRTVDPVKHEAKRAEILEAAARCFARDGFHRATVAQICAEAKMSPGHLYHYFASKEAIVGAIVDAGQEGASARFAKLTASANAITALVAELARLRTLHRKSGGGVQLEVLAEAGRSPAIGAVIQESSKGVRKLLADLLRQGQRRGQIDPDLDAEMAAAVLISVNDGAKSLLLRDPKLDAKKSAKTFELMITRFLAPR